MCKMSILISSFQAVFLSFLFFSNNTQWKAELFYLIKKITVSIDNGIIIVITIIDSRFSYETRIFSFKEWSLLFKAWTNLLKTVILSLTAWLFSSTSGIYLSTIGYCSLCCIIGDDIAIVFLGIVGSFKFSIFSPIIKYYKIFTSM